MLGLSLDGERERDKLHKWRGQIARTLMTKSSNTDVDCWFLYGAAVCVLRIAPTRNISKMSEFLRNFVLKDFVGGQILVNSQLHNVHVAKLHTIILATPTFILTHQI